MHATVTPKTQRVGSSIRLTCTTAAFQRTPNDGEHKNLPKNSFANIFVNGDQQKENEYTWTHFSLSGQAALVRLCYGRIPHIKNQYWHPPMRDKSFKALFIGWVSVSTLTEAQIFFSSAAMCT